MRESADLQVFLEEADKNSWSERVPWYERGVTSDALKGVSDWFHNTVRLDDTGTAANLLAGAAAGAAAAQGAAAAAASKARGAAAGAGAAPGVARPARLRPMRPSSLRSTGALRRAARRARGCSASTTRAS